MWLNARDWTISPTIIFESWPSTFDCFILDCKFSSLTFHYPQSQEFAFKIHRNKGICLLSYEGKRRISLISYVRKKGIFVLTNCYVRMQEIRDDPCYSQKTCKLHTWLDGYMVISCMLMYVHFRGYCYLFWIETLLKDAINLFFRPLKAPWNFNLKGVSICFSNLLAFTQNLLWEVAATTHKICLNFRGIVFSDV